MKMLALAIAIASEAFKTKLDKGGQPYILHCLRVMNNVGDDLVTKICAVLHDLVEDCPEWTFLRLRQEGFSEEVIYILQLLTRIEGEDYMEDYINRIALHNKATGIKRADLRDNSDITRLKGISKKDIDRIQKYHTAYLYLS